MRHFYEEPLICPEYIGSGAIFFSYCSLKCVFCQNFQLSHEGEGRDFTVKELAGLFKLVESKNVANLNLVTPTHYTGEILEALKLAKPKIPVVWNTSGYETAENIEKLKGYVDIFLFDCKYFSGDLALKYSKAPDYFENCIKAIKKAREIIGEDVIENGVMKKGLIIRHLVLPNHSDDSVKIFDEIAKTVGVDTIISVMSQYVPMFKADGEISRTLYPLEYKKVLTHINKLGFENGFMQDFASQNCEYTPDFSAEKFFEF